MIVSINSSNSLIYSKYSQYLFSKFDNNIIMSFCGFLTNENLSIIAANVCKKWRDITEEIGKKRCEFLKLRMPMKIASLTFKRLAATPRGNVYLDTKKITLYQHDTMNGPLSWKDTAQYKLFVAVIIYNYESIQEHLEKFPETTKFENGNGSWQISYSKLTNRRFPVWIPFRFFVKKDGRLAGNGDTIKLIYQNQPILLDCTPGPSIEDFSDELTKRLLKHQSLLYQMRYPLINTSLMASDALKNASEWMREDIHLLESSESSK